MKIHRLSTFTKRTLTVAGLVVGLVGVAHADTITYQFESDSQAGDTEFDGSTITLSDPANPTINAWDIKDNGTDFTTGFVLINTITSYSLTGFEGGFTIQAGPLLGGDLVIGADGPSGPLNPDGGFLSGVADPLGFWTEIADVGTVGTVPDSASTLSLLSGVLSVMAGIRYSIRRK